VTWPQLLGLAAVSYALKALGLVVLGSAPPRGRAADAVRLLPAALLAALVATQTFSEGEQLVLDARAVGLAFAGVAVWRRWPFTVVVIGAAAVTALCRWVT
jgi:uncharacterized membrane protein